MVCIHVCLLTIFLFPAFVGTLRYPPPPPPPVIDLWNSLRKIEESELRHPCANTCRLVSMHVNKENGTCPTSTSAKLHRVPLHFNTIKTLRTEYCIFFPNTVMSSLLFFSHNRTHCVHSLALEAAACVHVVMIIIVIDLIHIALFWTMLYSALQKERRIKCSLYLLGWRSVSCTHCTEFTRSSNWQMQDFRYFR